MGVSPTEQEDRDVESAQEDMALRGADQQLFEDIVWPTLAERVPAFEELKMTSSWAGFYDYNSVDQVSTTLSFMLSRAVLILCHFSLRRMQSSDITPTFAIWSFVQDFLVMVFNKLLLLVELLLNCYNLVSFKHWMCLDSHTNES